MKKLSLLLALFVLLALVLTGCQSAASSSLEVVSEFEPIPVSFPTDPQTGTGEWSCEEAVPGTMSEEAKTAFDTAVGGLDGVSYKALACIGTQSAAGVNYAILAKTETVTPDATPALKVLFISDAVDADAVLTDVVDFTLTDYTDSDATVKPAQLPVPGGWTVPEGGSLGAMPERLASAYSRAFTDYTTMQLIPLACAGTQVVSGTKYAMVCSGTTADEGSATGLYVVVIYDSIQEPAVVTSVCPLSVSALVPAE